MVDRLIGLFIFCASLTSCGFYRLSKNDLDWQPYKVGDLLVFTSNEGEIDTVLIESIKSNMNADDPLALFPDHNQSLFVTSKKGVLSLSTYKGRSYLELDFFLKTKTYKSSPSTIVQLNNEFFSTLERRIFMGHRVFKIEARTRAEALSHINWDLQQIYWSKEYGYMLFEFKDGYYWTIQSFIRDGKDLLK